MPHTINIVGIVNKGIIGKYMSVLVYGVDVENKQSARVHEQRYTVKSPLQISPVGDMVEAVKRADAGIYGTVQIEPLHPLTQKQHLEPHIGSLIHSLREHIVGAVNAVYIHSPALELESQRAGTAGKVESYAPVMIA